MGVIYKLKKEVIDFIISQKKENPSLSCRKISELASAKFDSKISKSSVNTILKAESLSSSIGRRSSQNKKFTIPAVRKKAISAGVYEVLKKDDQKSAFESESANDSEKTNQIQKETQNQNSQMRQDLDKNVGLLFVKAFEQIIFPKQKMIKFIELLKDSFWDYEKIQSIIESFFESIGVESSETALKAINDVSGEKKKNDLICDLKEKAESCLLTTEQKMSLVNDLFFAGQMVQSIQVEFSDGKNLFFTPDLRKMSFNHKIVQKEFPLQKCIEGVSEKLISNHSSLNVVFTELTEEDENALGYFINFCEGQDPNIKNIILLDNNQEEITEFNIIPRKKRIFTIVFSGDHEIHGRILKSAKWAKSQEYDIFGDIFKIWNLKLPTSDTPNWLTSQNISVTLGLKEKAPTQKLILFANHDKNFQEEFYQEAVSTMGSESYISDYAQGKTFIYKHNEINNLYEAMQFYFLWVIHFFDITLDKVVEKNIQCIALNEILKLSGIIREKSTKCEIMLENVSFGNKLNPLNISTLKGLICLINACGAMDSKGKKQYFCFKALS